MTDWKPIRPFDIDDGQLDGLRLQDAFVLGYELALVDEALKRPEAFERHIHAENMERIESQCQRMGRAYVITWMHSDGSESWKWLSVLAVESEHDHTRSG